MKWTKHKVVHWTLVLIVFGLTGSSIARLDTFLTEAAGFEKYSWFWWLMLVVLLPVYSLVLLGFAFLFGKFQYFKAKQAKMYQRLFGWFGKKK